MYRASFDATEITMGNFNKDKIRTASLTLAKYHVMSGEVNENLNLNLKIHKDFSRESTEFYPFFKTFFGTHFCPNSVITV
jgi:hypothetical protein